LRLWFLGAAIFLAIVLVTTVQHEKQLQNPGFNYYAPDQRDNKVLIMFFFAFVLLMVYYVVYCLSFILACSKVKKADRLDQLCFYVNSTMHFFVFLAIVAGAYRQQFEDLKSQLFFFGLTNFYTFLLIYVAWPIRARFQGHNDEGSELEEQPRPS